MKIIKKNFKNPLTKGNTYVIIKYQIKRGKQSMKIKHLSPEPYTTRLEELSKGTVFRFPKSSTPYMLLPNITGDEIKVMYKYRYGGPTGMFDDIEIYDENLYIWAEDGDGDSLDENEYLNGGEDEELIAYICLDNGKILLSHRHEIVIPLNAELTVEDMWSPD